MGYAALKPSYACSAKQETEEASSEVMDLIDRIVTEKHGG